MKLTTKTLTGILVVMLAGLLCSNMILKKEFDKMDKSDIYWTYDKLLEKPFRYLKIKGGNNTNIAFEQSANCSVRVLSEWKRYHNGYIQTSVMNDTLFVEFPLKGQNEYEREWMKRSTLVRIFSPQLLSVEGVDTKFDMFRLKQKSLVVNMSGKSSFEVESISPDFDTLNIRQRDSCEVVFEMSPGYTVPTKDMGKSPKAMTVQWLKADLRGNTLFDIGHAQIGSMELDVSDSSAIILSGEALKKVKR